MRIAYDAAKSRRNVKERGIGFESAMELLSGTYVMRRDTRRD
jgi:uncharacterized DUF497 family protein